MATTSPHSGNGAIASVVHASTDGRPVTIDDAELLFRGDYAREGSDLVISLDGRAVVVEGYFSQASQSDIAAPSGAFLSGTVVDALAGPLAPGQYAQDGAIASGLREIGKVIKLEGTASVTHPDGTTVDLHVGDEVYQGDVVQTAAGSKLGVSFLDDSVFSLSENARMVLDKLVYDPDDKANSSMVFNLVEGAFVFVTGQVAPSGNMQIQTPVATMGIRGTTPKVFINTLLGVVEFTVLPDPGSGHVGSYVLLDPRTNNVIGRVDSSGDKWVVTTLSGEAVKIGKSGFDLLEDQLALDELRDVVAKAFGDHTQVDSTHLFSQVAFNSSSANNANNGGNDDGSNNGGPGGGPNTSGDPGKDDPPIAGDDAFNIDEDESIQANVIDGSGGPGSGDYDPDGYALKVTAVNGDPLIFGNDGYTTVDLPSGATLRINADGDIHSYDPNDAYDFLGRGDVDIDTFTYTVRDPNGFTDTATVTVTLTGRNDRPEITDISTSEWTTKWDDAFTEFQDETGSSDTRTASGTVTFVDWDASDTHSVPSTVDADSVIWTKDGGVTESLSDIGTISFHLTETPPTTDPVLEVAPDGSIISVPDPVTGGVDWTYTVADGELDFLGEGETLTITYTVTITDDSGAGDLGTGVDAEHNESDSVTQTVTITITGTNDTPVITFADDSGTVTDVSEAPDVPPDTNAGDLTTSGSIEFADADLTDRPTADKSTVSITWFAADEQTTLTLTPSQIAALEAAFTIDPDGASGPNTNNGTIDWDYTIAEDLLDFLGTGEHVTAVFKVTITDDEGATTDQVVTITINGSTADAPVIEVHSGDSAGDSLAETNAGLTASGTLTVYDVDTTDTVTVTVDSVVASDTTAGLGSTNGDLLDMLTLTSGAIDADVGDTGNLAWTFDSDTEAFDYLAVGEQLVLTYTITGVDSSGNPSNDQTVTITITGTNDDPVIDTATGAGIDTGSITELTDADTDENNFEHSATGTIDFSDVDVSDTHTVSFTADTNNPAIASASFVLTNPTTTSSTTDGDFGWEFTIDDADIDYLAVGETLTFTYTVTLDDGHGGTDTRDVTVTVTGTNDAPVIDATAGNGIDTGSITELTDADTDENNFEHSATGTIDFSDVDVSDTHTVSFTADTNNPAITSASFVLTTPTSTSSTTDGDFGWEFTIDDADIDYLAVGETLTFTYTVTLDDGHGGTDTRDVTVTVTGTNDAPVMAVEGSDSTGTTVPETNAGLTANGTLTVTDADLSDTVSATVVSVDATDTTTGLGSDNTALLAMLTLTTGAIDADTGDANNIDWSFDSDTEAFDYLAAGEQLTLTYTVRTTDSQTVDSNTETVTIVITGTNDAPVLAAGSGDSTGDTLTETDAGLTANGTLTVTDADLSDTVDTSVVSVVATDTTTGLVSNNTALLAMLTLTSGPIDADAGTAGNLAWSFDSDTEAFDYLAAGEQLTLTYTVRTTDSQSADSNDETVTIVITGTNDAPVVQAQTLSGTEDNNVSGTVTATDVDSTDVTFSLVANTAVGGTVSAFDANTGAFTFTPDANFSGTASFDVIANDGLDDSAVQTITIDLSPDGDAPTLALSAPGADKTTSFGDEFTVNEQVENNQYMGDVISLGGDSALFVWRSDDPDVDGNFSGISARVGTVQADGSIVWATAGEFTVNELTANNQESPQALLLGDGRVLFTWHTNDLAADGSGPAVVCRTGTIQSNGSISWDTAGEQVVDAQSTDSQQIPQVVELSDGRLLFTWQSFDPDIDSSGGGIATRIGTLQSDGNITWGSAGELAVNVETDSFQNYVHSIELGDGRILFTWTSNDADVDGDGTGISARVGTIDSNGGISWDSEITVNSAVTGDQYESDALLLEDGRVLFVWTSADTGASSVTDIVARVGTVESNGTITWASAEFTVNNETDGAQNVSHVTTLPDGRVLFTWQSSDPSLDGSATAVSARIGTVQGDGSIVWDSAEFVVNENGASDQTHPEFTVLDDGRVVFAWESYSTPDDADGTGISARVLDVGISPENATIAINIDATITDTDGSEALASLQLSGFPDGATFSLGHADGTNWVIDDSGELAQLDSDPLVMTPPTGFDGTFTLSVVATVLDSATLSTGADSDTATTTATIDITIFDTDNAPAAINALSFFSQDSSQSAGSNEPPVVSTGATTLDYHQNDGAVVLDSSVKVTDIDSPLLAGATVTIGTNYDAGSDMLGFVDQNGIAGHFDALTGTLTLTGAASPLDYQTALRSVTFSSDDTTSSDDRTISYVVNDGIDDSATVTGTVTVHLANMVEGTPDADAPLDGTSGNDILFGLYGDDALFAGDGNDVLHGGPGNDVLEGGAGADTFVFEAGGGTDTVNDYSFAENDALDISALLDANFSPDNSGGEISFQQGESGAILLVNDSPVAELAGVGESSPLNIVYDDQQHIAQIAVSYANVGS